ncbi:MAG: CRISPR-associated endonuclease Cas2 [Candidatus Sungbacteria bacterium]|nr:CRISPR-associated endonuclease Cas2 [Candidatus Sungbacteria bacterium]
MAKITVEREEHLKKGKIAHEILRILGERPIALAAYRSADLNSLFLPRLEERGIGRRRKNSVRVAIERLRRQKFIEYRNEETKSHINLTEAGSQRLRQYNIENLTLEPERRWDQTWRIVMFDIPEELKRARDALARKLKELGFQKLQKSVFVHFTPCREEIQFVAEFFGVERHVTYVEAHSLGNREGDIRRHFKLAR